MRYNSTSVTRHRTGLKRGAGIWSTLKKGARLAAKNAPTILKGARAVAKLTGNKRLQSTINSKLFDRVAAKLANEKPGSGIKRMTKSTARLVINQMVQIYGITKTRAILNAYLAGNKKGGSFFKDLIGTIWTGVKAIANS